MAPRSDRVVLLACDGDSTSIVYNALAKHFSWERVVIEPPVTKRELFRRRAKRYGIRTVAGQLAFGALALPILRAMSKDRIREVLRTHALDRTPPPESAVDRVSSVNAAETIELLRRIDPAVVVVNGTRILSKSVLSSVPATFLNTHAGMTPRYRGVHGGYWALVEKRRALCGVTVHVVDPGIDTGDVVAQAKIEPTASDSFVTYPYLQIAAAIPLLNEAVYAALAGELRVITPADATSKLWSHPTLGQYAFHRLMSGVK
jgi:folate-dependent phosphoribosylglycinamide formyltransferase PurN